MRLVTLMIGCGFALIVFGSSTIENFYSKLGAAILIGTVSALIFEAIFFGGATPRINVWENEDPSQ